MKTMINQEQFNVGQLLNSEDTSLIELGFELCKSLNYSILETYYLGRFPNAKKSGKILFR